MDPKYCPSCGARLNDTEVREGWCESCGKKLPASITAVEPRSRGVFEHRGEPEVDDETWSRRRREDVPAEVSPEVTKKRREAAGALFAVVVMQIICGIAAFVVLPNQIGGPLPDEVVTILAVTILAVVVVYSLLAWWALHQPLPPAIIGLVLYIVVFVVDFVMAEGNLPRVALYIRIGIIALLIAGLQAAIKANSMSAETEARD